MDADLKQFLEGTERRLREGIVGEFREYIDERTHDAETRLVRAFGVYSKARSAS
jgi:hypothetical protein